jgi:hypothetical protein
MKAPTPYNAARPHAIWIKRASSTNIGSIRRFPLKDYGLKESLGTFDDPCYL